MKKILLASAAVCVIVSSAFSQNSRPWATYFGGNDQDVPFNIATDAAGNVYLVGQTESTTGIATPGAHQGTLGGGTDAFIVKYNSAGTRLWATYYGGSGSDYGNGVKADAFGNVYLTGYTSSTDSIASPGSYQSVFGGTTDAFIVKFNSAGVRQWATYYGGTDFDWGSNVACDASGNVFMAGFTQGTTGFSTPGAYQINNGGNTDAFIVKFDPTGARVWGTYFGGPALEAANDIATDPSGNIVISGTTYSNSGVAVGGHQTTYGGGLSDAFAVKFSNAGVFQWSSYYGGLDDEEGFGIAAGPGNVVYLVGMTGSSNNIASGGYQNTIGGNDDAFLVKFNSAGVRQWGTYYGGTGEEEGYGAGVDMYGNVFLSGDVYSPNVLNNIATANGFQTNIIGTENSMLAAFTSNGTRVAATYFGRIHEENCRVAVTSFGTAYINGWTMSQTGITYNGFQNGYGGNPYDCYVVKFNTSVPDTGIVVPNDTVAPTPTSTGPIVISGVSIYDGGGISLANAVLKNFSPGEPLPSSGSIIITLNCEFTGTYTASGPPISVTCPAVVKMKITFASSSGPTRVFDTEMLQLDLSGGNLPPGVEIRESPTLQSLGQLLQTDIGGGEFRMASFFDVFTELSTDNGADWTPGNADPSRLMLRQNSGATIPTLSEWGLISLGVILLAFGIFFSKTRIA